MMKLTHTLLTLLVCTTVVLAGCTGVSDLTGGSGGGTDDGATAGADDGSGGASDGNDGASNGSGADDSSSGGSISNGAGAASNAGAGSEDGSDAEDAGTAGESGAGDSSSSASGGSSSSASLHAEDEWFNLSKPGKYVFEIESAEKGTGRMSFETTTVSGGQVSVKTTYELGDESSESTVTGPVGEARPQLASSPAYAYLLAIQFGGIGAGALAGGEELEVGNEFSQQSAEGSVNVKVTGTDSYAGVDCYVVKTRLNGTLNQQVCTQEAFSSAPYVATYDENGDLSQRVELVEYERG